MTIDEDILTADANTLEKIKTQDWRNDAAARRRIEEARSKAMRDQATTAAGIIDQTVRLEMFANLFSSIAPNYLKPSTATTPEGQAADVAKDVAYLDRVITEALKVFDKHLTRG